MKQDPASKNTFFSNYVAGSLLCKMVFWREGINVFCTVRRKRIVCGDNSKDILLQLLFDELEDLDERLRTFKADAKSENTSVKVGRA